MTTGSPDTNTTVNEAPQTVVSLERTATGVDALKAQYPGLKLDSLENFFSADQQKTPQYLKLLTALVNHRQSRELVEHFRTHTTAAIPTYTQSPRLWIRLIQLLEKNEIIDTNAISFLQYEKFDFQKFKSAFAQISAVFSNISTDSLGHALMNFFDHIRTTNGEVPDLTRLHELHARIMQTDENSPRINALNVEAILNVLSDGQIGMNDIFDFCSRIGVDSKSFNRFLWALPKGTNPQKANEYAKTFEIINRPDASVILTDSLFTYCIRNNDDAYKHKIWDLAELIADNFDTVQEGLKRLDYNDQTGFLYGMKQPSRNCVFLINCLYNGTLNPADFAEVIHASYSGDTRPIGEVVKSVLSGQSRTPAATPQSSSQFSDPAPNPAKRGTSAEDDRWKKIEID